MCPHVRSSERRASRSDSALLSSSLTSQTVHAQRPTSPQTPSPMTLDLPVRALFYSEDRGFSSSTQTRTPAALECPSLLVNTCFHHANLFRYRDFGRGIPSPTIFGMEIFAIILVQLYGTAGSSSVSRDGWSSPPCLGRNWRRVSSPLASMHTRQAAPRQRLALVERFGRRRTSVILLRGCLHAACLPATSSGRWCIEADHRASVARTCIRSASWMG
ncbi:hypothetical protein DFH07DRAFT_314245 [Mycena maculata]|uniref:Uncharacterized protein n=1 Tax=Mycena maculata TaxID=230809 RepID=A0AAD7MIP6_9AGAR|nr:hypothetical protein DFH07DRAFT_314245 [Mycena maculata]